MLRLQLLPDHVFEGGRIKKATIFCVLIFLIDAVVCFAWFATTKTAMTSMAQQSEVASGFQSQISALDAEIGGLEAQIAPVDSKHDYILGLKDYGDQWTEKMRELSKFIYARVEVLSAQLDSQGFELEVRTKTTEDVARMLMNLKVGYAAGLIQQDSLNVTGLTGWPHLLTSPKTDYTIDQAMHIDIGSGLSLLGQGTSSPGSNSNPGAQRSQGGEFSGSEEMGGSGEMSPEENSSSEMGMEPGFEGSGGAGGAAVGQRASAVDSDVMRALAVNKYIKPSVDKPPQPYLNLTIEGRWQSALVEPTGNTPAGSAPAGGGMDSGMSGMDPMMEGAPPMDEASGGEPPPE